MLMGLESFDAFRFEDGEPALHGIGIAWAQQAVLGNPVRCASIRHFQDGGGTLSDVGAWIVIAMPSQAFVDFVGQCQSAFGFSHLVTPADDPSIPLPILTVKTQYITELAWSRFSQFG